MQRAERTRPHEARKIFTIIGGVFALVLVLAYASQLHWQGNVLRDYDGYVIGVDFVNSWMMGRAAWQGDAAANYEIIGYNHQVRALFGADDRILQCSYPPSFLILAGLFGWLPYGLALAAFWLVSLGVGWWVLRAEPKADQLAIAAAPAGLIAFLSGQTAFLLAALQLLILRWLDRRPVAAGLLLGLLAIKPHLAIAYPFFLIATRRWQVFAAAALSTAGVVACTWLVWGGEVWHAYLTLGAPLQNAYVLAEPTMTVRAWMPTIYMDARLLGLSYDAAMGVQVLFALGALAAFFHPRVRNAAMAKQMLVLALVGVIATPYLMSYDLLFLSACIVLWLRRQPALDREGMALLIGCFFLPILHFVMGVAGIAGSALLPVALLGWLITRK